MNPLIRSAVLVPFVVAVISGCSFTIGGEDEASPEKVLQEEIQQEETKQDLIRQEEAEPEEIRDKEFDDEENGRSNRNETGRGPACSRPAKDSISWFVVVE